MKKLSETLIILDHLGSIIKERVDFCHRQKDYCVNKEIKNYIFNKNFTHQELKEKGIIEELSRKDADIKVIIHNYTRLNIIDMFSFNDEYNGFFHENCSENNLIRERIRKVRNENKLIYKEFDWEQLRRYRNIINAHNLRDKKDSNKLSVKTLKEINKLMINGNIGIKYPERVLNIYKNIKSEFKIEIEKGKIEFIEKSLYI